VEEVAVGPDRTADPTARARPENERILCGDLENPLAVFNVFAPRTAMEIVAARATVPPVKFEQCPEGLGETLLP
jgi:hypothetical protein